MRLGGRTNAQANLSLVVGGRLGTYGSDAGYRPRTEPDARWACGRKYLLESVCVLTCIADCMTSGIGSSQQRNNDG